ncbi:transglycosylase domain-containing protein [Streptomyces sp. NPDC006235]|uniref:transglycosylase domain-containing protein n=1 Tax=Streptomyces sp. NPDC006235 TaxID=3156736 RepID=UPI0033AE8C87
MLLLTLAMGLTCALFGAYWVVDIPEPHPDAVSQSTVFVDVHGLYIGRRGPVDRQQVQLSRIPSHLQEAVIAAENRSFWQDSGVSPSSIARAALATCCGGEPQGGSTITQQYVKNALLSPERSMSRKVREALISLKLSRTRSKEDILEGYLNTVYFGRAAAGVQAAARVYFGVNVGDLTLSQSAALAAIVNIPSYYERAGADPQITKKLVKRWTWVLDAMAADGSVSPAERARARFPVFIRFPPGRTEGQRQYLMDVAAAEAAKRLGIDQDELARSGYTVHTTFDLSLQDTAVEAVRTQGVGDFDTADRKEPTGEGQSAAGQPRTHAAIAGVVPGDGAIRVLCGGFDYARQPFNDALNGAVEAGSALRPFHGLRLRGPLRDLAGEATPTPLRVAAAYAALAAQGRHAAPYSVTKITRGSQVLYTEQPSAQRAMSAADATRAVNVLPARTSGGAPKESTGSAGTRTTWHIDYGPRLALTVALFADVPAVGDKPARPVSLKGLTGHRTAAAAAGSIATSVWAAADSTHSQSGGQH